MFIASASSQGLPSLTQNNSNSTTNRSRSNDDSGLDGLIDLFKEVTISDFDRVQRANNRATSRQRDNCRKFETYFNFTEVTGRRNQYSPDYKVTLKEEHKHLPLKKVLEILQQHRHTRYKNSKLDVRINILGDERGFRMDPSSTNQVMTKTMTQGYVYSFSHTRTYKDGYEEASRILDKADSALLARTINEALDAPVSTQPTEHSHIPSQTQAIVSLISFSQVAESVPGRTPGMNKLARQSFSRIGYGETTFWEEFNKTDGKYYPSAEGGTPAARQSIRYGAPQRASEWRELKDYPVPVSFRATPYEGGYMSDSSDDGN